jgi:hypothetical protein
MKASDMLKRGGVKVVSRRVYRGEGNESPKEDCRAANEGRKVRGGKQVEIGLGEAKRNEKPPFNFHSLVWSYAHIVLQSTLLCEKPIQIIRHAWHLPTSQPLSSLLGVRSGMVANEAVSGRNLGITTSGHSYDNDGSSATRTGRIREH